MISFFEFCTTLQFRLLPSLWYSGNTSPPIELQILPCDAVGAVFYVLQGTGGDDAASTFSSLRAEVDDVVGSTDDVKVVLNDEDAVTQFDEPAEGTQ